MNSDRDTSMGRCFAYADRDVPQEILENISGEKKDSFLVNFWNFFLEIADLPPVTKKLSEYSEEERAAFPNIIESSSAIIYEEDDISERYFWDKTKPEKMGPVGSRQELEFYKDSNMKEYHKRDGKILKNLWLAKQKANRFS